MSTTRVKGRDAFQQHVQKMYEAAYLVLHATGHDHIVNHILHSHQGDPFFDYFMNTLNIEGVSRVALEAMGNVITPAPSRLPKVPRA